MCLPPREKPNDEGRPLPDPKNYENIRRYEGRACVHHFGPIQRILEGQNYWGMKGEDHNRL